MNRFLLYTLILLATTDLFSQSSYFSLRHDFHNTFEVGWNILETQGKYLSVTANGDSLGFIQIGLNFWDYDGNMLVQKTYGRPFLHFYPGFQGSLTENQDGGYSLLGNWEDSTGQFACLVKFNRLGDTLWTKKYGTGVPRIIGSQAKQTTDEGFILFGRSEEFDEDGDFWLAKTDSLGEIEWEKTYGRGVYDYGLSVDLHPDGGYILTGYTRSFGPIVPGTGSNIWVIKVDREGFIEWDKVLGGKFGDCGWSVQTTSDYGFIVAGCKADTMLWNPDGYIRRHYMAKLDYFGNIEWERTYGGASSATTLFMVREVPSGGYIACGQMYEPNQPSKQSAVTLRVAANGDSLWMRIQKLLLGPQSINILRDIRPTSDQGFIATGWVLPAPPDTAVRPNIIWRQDLWILKLDSMGCASPGCQFATALEPLLARQKGLALSNYPNPFSGSTTITYALPVDGEITLFDLAGRTLMTFPVTAGNDTIYLKDGTLQAGTYFYRLTTTDGRSISKIMIVKGDR